MKQVLTKEEVAGAMALMKSEGKKITLNSLHAALNHRGSMTTLMRLKSELEIAAQPAGPVASPEGLATFWELWALAVDEGRKQQEPVINQLREDQKALTAENERLDGLATARENQANELDKDKAAAESELVEVKTRLEQELKAAQLALLGASEQTKDALTKLAEEQSARAEQVDSLNCELASAVVKCHEIELDLVRANTTLETRENKPLKK